ncbi:glycosyltransferase [Thalassotalea fonticola]|uniref:Glycosyltransferase n=1 Tax=Thalassotalea fonticola TaxID=3065649 RepID=A0ABZ0GP97_9GAMM|nr:glycosyltransferase [Colwelliaceae bacterium S1-1]
MGTETSDKKNEIEFKQLKTENVSLRKELNDLQNSFAYNLGKLLVTEARTIKGLLFLPAKLFQLWKSHAGQRKKFRINLKTQFTLAESRLNRKSMAKIELPNELERYEYTELINKSINFSNNDKEILVYLAKKKDVSNTVNVDIDIGKKCNYIISDDFVHCISLPLTEEVNRAIVNVSHTNCRSLYFYSEKLSQGINIIVPVYKGEQYVHRCIESINRQTIDKSLLDIILILNGPKDNSEQIISDFIEQEPNLNIVVMKSEIANASAARNLGIEIAKRQYTVFLDVDDELSSNYLSNLMNKASPETIVISNLKDIHGSRVMQSGLAIKPLDKKGLSCALNDYSSLVTMNGCKLIPTFYLKATAFDTALKSGEDVILMAKIIALFKPQICGAANYEETYYIRHIVADSISRQVQSFEFNVKQRLQVIVALEGLIYSTSDDLVYNFLTSKIKAQSDFVINYLTEFESDYKTFVEVAKQLNISNESIQAIAQRLSKSLVIAYCFSPYADTSAVVMAKRTRYMSKPVDVIYNKMDRVRDKDENLPGMISSYIGNEKCLSTYTSFSNWLVIEQFCSNSLRQIRKWKMGGKEYKCLYSRAMWPASHFAAALVKLRSPQIKWLAEFSDPLYLDVHGKPRKGDISYSWLDKNGFIAAIKKLDIDIPKTKELFFWCEFLPYILADELLFTNENQLEYMCSYIKDEDIIHLVKSKATISHHPQPLKQDYQLKSVQYPLDEAKVNFAYFGTFYATRGLGELFAAIRELTTTERSKICVHIFTNEQTRQFIDNDLSDLHDVIVVNDYVSYFEFLNLCTKVDCLVVRDAETKGNKIINPYLPSKLSDYLGSGTDVWALYEKGSVLNKYVNDNQVKYSSEIFDNIDASNTLTQIIRDKI